MNYIEKFQKFFHTDKLWGKVIFTSLIYVIFWFVFYGSWLFIPSRFFNRNNNLTGILFLLYIFIIIPFLSFYIPKFIKKMFQMNTKLLYVIHIFLLILSLAVFLIIGILSALSHFSIG